MMTELQMESKKTGRPQLTIDWERVDRMLEAGCSGVEVAASVGVHRQTLYTHCESEKGMSFGEYSSEKHAKGECMLRIKQFQEAMKGDRGMLIWLGKQLLGQRDNKDMKLENEGSIQIEVVNYGSNPKPKPYQSEVQ